MALELFIVLTDNSLSYKTLVYIVQKDNFGENKIKVIIEGVKL